MSSICSQTALISGLAENLEKVYEKFNSEEDAILLNTNELYSSFFDSDVDVEDWGAEWSIITSVEYEIGNSMMTISCDSSWFPPEIFWQLISKEYEVVVSLEYLDVDLEFFRTINWSDGQHVNTETMSYVEYLYYNNYRAFWREIIQKTNTCGADAEWHSFEEIVEAIGDVFQHLNEDELSKLQYIYDNRYREIEG
jgi:hypothetical protein